MARPNATIATNVVVVVVLAVALLGHTTDGIRPLDVIAHFTRGHADILCELTHHVKLCETLTVSPTAVSPKFLVDTALDTAVIKAQGAYIATSEMLEKSAEAAKDERLHQCLDTCRESYDSLVDGLRRAQQALLTDAGRDDVVNHFSAAGKNVEACRDAFGKFPGVHSEKIDRMNENLQELVTDGIDLAANLLF